VHGRSRDFRSEPFCTVFRKNGRKADQKRTVLKVGAEFKTAASLGTSSHSLENVAWTIALPDPSPSDVPTASNGWRTPTSCLEHQAPASGFQSAHGCPWEYPAYFLSSTSCAIRAAASATPSRWAFSCNCDAFFINWRDRSACDLARSRSWRDLSRAVSLLLGMNSACHI